jgi:hypothetical protein
MSFLVSGQPLTDYAKLTNNTLTTVFTATKRTTVVSMAFTETNGGTQTLTVLRSDPTPTSYYFRNALGVTGKQRVLIDEVFALNAGDTIKAQSGDASGYFDVMITYLAPDALASR